MRISPQLLLLLTCTFSEPLTLTAFARSSQAPPNHSRSVFPGLNSPVHQTRMANFKDDWTTENEVAANLYALTGDYAYSLETHPETGVGGWLQHRLSLDAPGSGPGDNWTDEVEIDGAIAFAPEWAQIKHPPRILVLYGSLREPRAFSRFLALECARLLERMGCDVRVYNPRGLPVRDPAIEDHPKVQELRALSDWSEGHVWVSPEMHGTTTACFKNQIDWLPLNTGSVRPTQGRTAVVLQVNGGSQSFNVVNELRKLARWMRMPCSTNQSSVAMAWKEFDDDGRMKDSSFRERVVDVVEEFHKFTLVMREYADFLNDRHSERKEKAEKGRLQTQAEKEAAKDAAKAEAEKDAANNK